MEVIILGMGLSRSACPYDAEVWSVNNGYKQTMLCLPCHTDRRKTVILEPRKDKMCCPDCGFSTPVPRIDKIFLAHTQCWDYDGDALFNWEELNYLAAKGVEIINTHRVKGLNATIFPIKTILKRFKRNYFSDSIAYMVAYALYKGCTKLRFYGVDMHTMSEYAQEKGGIEYWLGRAEERGVEIELSQGTAVLQTATGHPYGTNISQRLYYYDNKGRKRLYKQLKKPPDFKSNFNALDKIRTPQ